LEKAKNKGNYEKSGKTDTKIKPARNLLTEKGQKGEL
jgi:hypothetical protein